MKYFCAILRGILLIPPIVLAACVGWLADVCGWEAVAIYCEGVLFECAGRVIGDEEYEHD